MTITSLAEALVLAVSLVCSITTACMAETTSSPVSSRGAAFDRAAAAAALGQVNVGECKTPTGPTGPGHVTVNFGVDGHVSSAVVDGGPYPGTPEGACIAGRFRQPTVPPFEGTPVRVGKSFTID